MKNIFLILLNFLKKIKLIHYIFLSCKILPLKLDNYVLDGETGDDSKIIKINIRDEKFIAKIYKYKSSD